MKSLTAHLVILQLLTLIVSAGYKELHAQRGYCHAPMSVHNKPVMPLIIQLWMWFIKMSHLQPPCLSSGGLASEADTMLRVLRCYKSGLIWPRAVYSIVSACRLFCGNSSVLLQQNHRGDWHVPAVTTRGARLGIRPSFQCFPFSSLLSALREMVQMLLLLYKVEMPAVLRRTHRSGSVLPSVEQKGIA